MEKKIQLSCDGVHENKSTTTSIDVYSLKFQNCKHIYPYKLVRPLNKYKLDKKKELSDVINDIKENDIRIMQFIADKLKRSEAKDCKCHASWYACEYCYAKGSKIVVSDNVSAKKKIEQQITFVQQQINTFEEDPNAQEMQKEHLIALSTELKKSLSALNRKSNILWPFSTMGFKNRSRASHLTIVEKIENNEVLSIDQCKGVKGRSVLLNIPNFNFIYDVPAEYLHSGCLGVTKQLCELTFDVGKNRNRNTKRKLSSSAQFNILMLVTKVPKEFPRRARNLDFSVFKGCEYRNLAIFFFPLVIQCIDQHEQERTLWLLLAYMFRSCLIPSVEFAQINLTLVQECSAKFYKLFEEIFGPTNCTYNLHVFVGHLLEIRTHGPLTETSAFKFESFYGEIRRSFVPGTNSPLLQIMKNILLKRNITTHYCKNNISVTNYDTSLECNKLIYCYKNKEYLIYEVNDINDSVMSCNKVGQYPVSFDETPDIPWSTVGVFRKGGVCSENVEINSSEIDGKVINVGKYLITCPTNVLNEK